MSLVSETKMHSYMRKWHRDVHIKT